LILGGKYTVRTLWLGLLLNSGNDAANTLARVGGGAQGLPGTLAAMNAEARRLGAYDTHAETPHGLDGPGQVTSVYDLALIARACFSRADFSQYVATERAQIPAQPPRDKRGFQIQNDNRLLRSYPGALGGKGGFTDIARHNFVGAAQRDGRRLVVALLGAEHKPVRTWQQTAALLNWGFSLPSDTSVGRLVNPGEAEDPFATPSAEAPPAPAGVPVARPIEFRRSVVNVGIVVVAVLFASAWLGILLTSRRRRELRKRSPIR
jgi:D-alanyl-D-alanine carboxypeptidase (penicillin-binding protein 5/6)